uniref:Uncharacterized protein n=1 Tax=Rangifer tarandus platyrhynchus TaxID=3082113 RepID=A0ACB0E6Q6_RANTA|nr:unnamed protein product [Rangifer tarandus platyrhynchus]
MVSSLWHRRAGGWEGLPGRPARKAHEPAPHPPSRGLHLIWRRRDPHEGGVAAVETPPGQEMTGVSEGNRKLGLTYPECLRSRCCAKFWKSVRLKKYPGVQACGTNLGSASPEPQ